MLIIELYTHLLPFLSLPLPNVPYYVDAKHSLKIKDFNEENNRQSQSVNKK